LRVEHGSLRIYERSSYLMGVAETDGERFSTLESNAAAARVFGGRWPAPAALLWREHCRRAEAERTPLRFEYAHPCAGAERWLRVEIVFLGRGDAGGSRFSYVAEDITERRRTDELNAWLATFPERNPIPIVELSLATRTIHYLNASARERLPDLEARGFAHPWIEGLEQALGGAELAQRELAVGEHCYSQSITVVPGVGRVRVYGFDITERARAARALTESEERLRTAAEAAEFGTYDVDLRERRVVWSTRLREILGLPPDAPVGMRTIEAFLHPEDRERFLARTRQSYDPGGSGLLADEHRILRADGALRWMSVKGRTVFETDSGRRLAVRATGAAVDITEKKHAEQALREANRLKDEFLATLAHELRNPLAPILSALELLRLEDLGQHASAREIIERQVRHLVRLIDDLLDVSRITRDKLELRRQRLDAAHALQAALEASQPLIAAAGQSLELALPRAPVYVHADPTRLAQVIGNLLNNAARYSRPGGHIRLALAQRGDEAVISVRDTGLGIAPDFLPRIWDMFVQGDRSLEREQGGLGIGLTLVKRLVEMHGGRVEAKSEGECRGSEFLVRLPALAESPLEDTEDMSETEKPAAPGARRILVADDNADSANSLSLLLKMIGHEVRTAHDGNQALEIAAAFRPDVLLLDIGMPGLNGYDLARRVRESPWGRSAMVIAVTGWGQDQDRERSRQAGFDHHLVKPVEMATLEKLLNAPA
jgi:PAS domain S-box-containing protein